MSATPENSVHVSNISPDVASKTLSDFFSFCGRIEVLAVAPAKDGTTKEAVVVFLSESAAKTALLLTNAMLSERPISVAPYNESHAHLLSAGAAAAGGTGESLSSADIDHKQFGVDDASRTKTSVVASILAAGYVVGSDTLTKAKDYDNEHSLSATAIAGVKAGAAVVADKVSQTSKVVDEKLGLSEKAKTIDESYKVSEKAAVARDGAILGTMIAKDALATGANTVAEKLMANEWIAGGVGKLQAAADSLRAETASEIERRQAGTTSSVEFVVGTEGTEEGGEMAGAAAATEPAASSTTTPSSASEPAPV